jgi:hypothetical protein
VTSRSGLSRRLELTNGVPIGPATQALVGSVVDVFADEPDGAEDVSGAAPSVRDYCEVFLKVAEIGVSTSLRFIGDVFGLNASDLLLSNATAAEFPFWWPVVLLDRSVDSDII